MDLINTFSLKCYKDWSQKGTLPDAELKQWIHEVDADMNTRFPQGPVKPNVLTVTSCLIIVFPYNSRTPFSLDISTSCILEHSASFSSSGSSDADANLYLTPPHPQEHLGG